MPKKKTTQNRVNKNRFTMSQQRANANSAIDGRGGRKSAFTGGARSVDTRNDNAAAMRRLWEAGESNPTYTRTRRGNMSVDGRKTGGSTWTYTNRDMDGNFVSQSGRNKLATRRQRNYDTRVGMNNISQRTIDAWLRTGLAREVNGNLVGEGGNIIRQKADGNYSMGLTTG